MELNFSSASASASLSLTLIVLMWSTAVPSLLDLGSADVETMEAAACRDAQGGASLYDISVRLLAVGFIADVSYC